MRGDDKNQAGGKYKETHPLSAASPSFCSRVVTFSGLEQNFTQETFWKAAQKGIVMQGKERAQTEGPGFLFFSPTS